MRVHDVPFECDGLDASGGRRCPRCVCSVVGCGQPAEPALTLVLCGSARYGNVVAERHGRCDRPSRSSPGRRRARPCCAAPSTAWTAMSSDVVGEPAAVREAGEVAGEDAERVRRRPSVRRHVQPQHLRRPEGDAVATGRLASAFRTCEFRSTGSTVAGSPSAPALAVLMPVQEDLEQVVAVRRRSRHAVDRLDQLGQDRVEHLRRPRAGWSASRSGEIALNASFRLSGMTTSLTSGLPSRETWTNVVVRRRRRRPRSRCADRSCSRRR